MRGSWRGSLPHPSAKFRPAQVGPAHASNPPVRFSVLIAPKPMPDLCVYFQVHQPKRLLPCELQKGRPFREREDVGMNTEILNTVAENCYLPVNRMFRELINEHGGRFSFALSISGTAIEQMERYRPDVLDSFRELVAAGNVELLAETYHHSLAFAISNREFERQVEAHLEVLETVFHIRPRVFRNSELIYDDSIAARAETMGFDGVLAEGLESNLKGASPNFLYRAPHTARIKTLLRHTPLSDDIGFRFSDPSWIDHPLTAPKFADWMAHCPGDLVNLFMGYEAIGQHQKTGTGIFRFWQALPEAVIEAGLQWVTPSEAVDLYRASRDYACEKATSWTDGEHDLTAWMGNDMQQEAIAAVMSLERDALASGDPVAIHNWAGMLASNHFHWMSTKGRIGSSSHSPLIPYPTPRDAFERYMCALEALRDEIPSAAPRGNR